MVHPWDDQLTRHDKSLPHAFWHQPPRREIDAIRNDVQIVFMILGL